MRDGMPGVQMILAAADAAEGLGPPPEELQLAWHVKRWGSLPRAGGLDDQPVGLVARMATAGNVYDAIRSWRKSPNWIKWQADNPGAWDVVQAVIELRKQAEKYGG